MADATYSIEYAKSNRSTCKGTKEKIEKDALRIAKITLSDRGGGDPIQMSAWYLPVPFFQMMKRMRKGSKIVESTFDLAGFDDLKEEDRQLIEKMVKDYHDEDVDFPPKPPKKEKKRKEESEGGAADAPAPSPKKKAKAEPLGAEFGAETRPGVTTSMLRDITDELVGRLKAAGYNVPDEGARQQLGPVTMNCLADETLDVGEVLKQGAKLFGKKVEVACESDANAALAGAFKELSDYEFKGGAQMKGLAYKKVSAALSDHPTPITSGKEAAKLPGIGKSSAEKIDQFLATGKIDKLEEYKNQGRGARGDWSV